MRWSLSSARWNPASHVVGRLDVVLQVVCTVVNSTANCAGHGSRLVTFPPVTLQWLCQLIAPATSWATVRPGRIHWQCGSQFLFWSFLRAFFVVRPVTAGLVYITAICCARLHMFLQKFQVRTIVHTSFAVWPPWAANTHGEEPGRESLRAPVTDTLVACTADTATQSHQTKYSHCRQDNKHSLL